MRSTCIIFAYKSETMKDVIFKSYNRIITGFWVLISITIFLQFIEVCPFSEAVLFVVFFLIITFPIVTYLSKTLLPKALNTGDWKTFIFYFILLTLLLTFLYSCLSKGIVWLEEQNVFPKSAAFSGTDRPFYAEFIGNILNSFMSNVALCTLRFFEVHNKMSLEHAKLQQAHLEDQLKLLREQINPHLMFNVLNHIHILMKKNVDLADELLLRYSDVLRYQLYDCNKEKVLLEKEVDYLKDVVEVEKMRWGDELKVVCSWSIENGRKEISPLLLIPFVENSFKHVSRMPSKEGYVNITLNQESDTLRFIVENSKLDQAATNKKSSGIGLENVKKRLNILYPGKHELIIQKTDTIYKTTLIITL